MLIANLSYHRTTLCLQTSGYGHRKSSAGISDSPCMLPDIVSAFGSANASNRWTGRSGMVLTACVLALVATSLLQSSLSAETDRYYSLIVVNSKLSGANSFQGYANLVMLYPVFATLNTQKISRILLRSIRTYCDLSKLDPFLTGVYIR